MLQPTVDELARRGTPFVGLLYAGLALTARGVRVIEFNARFGDPETQPLLARLRTPLGGLLHAAATGRLADHPPLEWGRGAAVAVVLAAENYPGTPGHRRGDRRTGRRGHRRRAWSSTPAPRWIPTGRLISAGGRVLAVVGTGDDLDHGPGRGVRGRSARSSLAGSFYRTDIAAGGAARESRR